MLGNREMNSLVGSGSKSKEGSFEFTELLPPSHGKKRIKDYESLDYDMSYNEPYVDQLDNGSKMKTCWFPFLRPFTWYHGVMEWIMVFFIGAGTGLVAFFIDFCVKKLAKVKFDTTLDHIQSFQNDGRLIVCVLIITGFNCLYAIIAAALTAWEPVAAGSGIPEIKCYLNGVRVPNVARLRTLFAKAVGVLFSVAGGFLVGKEGPMIHSGAILGASIPQMQSVSVPAIDLRYKTFRTDRYKRDFVSAGAAAGVAAAFGAPIGGTLFSLEEGSSFWNQALTWRVFFCAMTSTFFLNILRAAVSHSNSWYTGGSPGLLDFGQFDCGPHCSLWNLPNLGIFVLIAVGGGLLGALFNFINTKLTIYRLKHLAKRHWIVRFLEAVLIGVMTSVLTFGSTIGLGHCVEANFTRDYDISNVKSGIRTYLCPNGSMNDLATLYVNAEEEAIKQLFHQPNTFHTLSLLVFVVLFFFLAVWTYGAGVPSGLFVPCLAIGAGYGRLVAELLKMAGYKAAYPSTFALIGAASFLGGVVRMTISLTVILIESTNEISYGLPIMVSLMVAKWVGDRFNIGLYDIHVELKEVPFLEWESPVNFHKLLAKDVMSPHLKYIYPHTSVRVIVNHLRSTVHNAFPIVSAAPSDTLLANLPKHPRLQSSEDDDDGDDITPTTNNQTPVDGELTPSVRSTPRHFESETRSSAEFAPSSSQRDYGIFSQQIDAELVGGDMLALDRRGRLSPVQLAALRRRRQERGRAFTMTTARLRVPKTIDEEAPEAGRPRSTPGRSVSPLAREDEASPVLGEEEAADEVFDRSGSDGLGEEVLLFHGLILRSQLVTLLRKSVWFAANQKKSAQPVLNHEDMRKQYPRFDDIHDITVPDLGYNKIMDVTPYMHPCPYTIHPLSPLPYVFNLFRTMGLRHLVVVDSHGQAVGMITRHDLTHEYLHNKLELVNQKED
eukprot:m.4821 g.4821  ORF g.4821 m.4821 type:complete len:944 (+) comp11335_c0_seq1:104-2935(+)